MTPKKLRLLFLVSSLSLSFLLSPAYCLLEKPPLSAPLLSSVSKNSKPVWWEIKLLLITKGNYKINEGQSSYPGNYSFTFLWTGCMEKDNGDFLLYRENVKLLQWEVQETALFPDFLRVLYTSNFLVKPSFNLNYILKKEGKLIFDFSVEGFYVPHNTSNNKFYLNLPVSKENSQKFSELSYDLHLNKSSNNISLKEKEIYHDSVEKYFSWKWNYRDWSVNPGENVYFTNSHEVKVKISITPHFEKR